MTSQDGGLEEIEKQRKRKGKGNQPPSGYPTHKGKRQQIVSLHSGKTEQGSQKIFNWGGERKRKEGRESKRP